MKFTLTNNDTSYIVHMDRAQSIAIPLDFGGSQPNHFGVPKANRKTYESDGFVGDTRRDGSCNVTTISTTPHCNGTHTETIYHIVDQEVLINEVMTPRLLVAALVTVQAAAASSCDETYRPALEPSDQVICSTELKKHQLNTDLPLDALIIRTTPNSSEKKKRQYGSDHTPAFFTVEAIDWIVEQGFDHILVDLPSVDKMYDEGKLTVHHRFWNVPEGSHSLTELSWTHKTITEMVFVPNEIQDGIFGMQIQIPSFCLDAAPSNPVLFPLEKI